VAGVDVIGRSYGLVVLDAVFPINCVGCGFRGASLCDRCVAELRRVPPSRPPPGVDGWAAVFAYEGAAREVVARLKYRNARSAVPWLAATIVGVAREQGLGAPVVTWPPTTRLRRRARGFDPAELLARAVARGMGARGVRLLDRRPGPPQTGLSAAARVGGPKFVARRSAPPRVLLVDDVATTGATLASAAAALRAAGAHTVVAVTAARTPPPGS
jgi:predicted amidophosphoribosyltransferase